MVKVVTVSKERARSDGPRALLAFLFLINSTELLASWSPAVFHVPLKNNLRTCLDNPHGI